MFNAANSHEVSGDPMTHQRWALTIVAARMEGQTLIATGRFPVKQSDYGMKPVSVGGVVSVKDTVNVSFTIVGH
jgi:hypothetical protein